jgi:GNAT superfamily N-acetyltransferase
MSGKRKVKPIRPVIGKKKRKSPPTRPRTPSTTNARVRATTPGYKVEVHTDPTSFKNALLNGNNKKSNKYSLLPNALRKSSGEGEDLRNFEINTDDTCDLGGYAIMWLLGPHKNDDGKRLVFVLRNMTTRKRAGFALCKIRPGKKSLYVDVICAREKRIGAGSTLMRAIEEYAMGQGLAYVELVSVPSPETINFYKKMGYRRGPPGATIAEAVKARHLYKRLENRYYSGAMNINAEQLNAFDGLLYGRNENERTQQLPKYHRLLTASSRKRRRL